MKAESFPHCPRAKLPHSVWKCDNPHHANSHKQTLIQQKGRANNFSFVKICTSARYFSLCCALLSVVFCICAFKIEFINREEIAAQLCMCTRSKFAHSACNTIVYEGIRSRIMLNRAKKFSFTSSRDTD